ncbi:hypothetical protein J3E07_001634 [Methanococcus voltae]|uniref:Uncharacterized protein n=1 Tax=Methanococcus voltae TaxID=2188 RepID=A0A8J7UTZ7_METVO|nr:hypothetical protein [Methanococcus voltae]
MGSPGSSYNYVKGWSIDSLALFTEESEGVENG